MMMRPTSAWDLVARLDATHVFTRVQYNPQDSKEKRDGQQDQLRQLASMCRHGDRKLIVELVPKPTQWQIDRHGDEATARAFVLHDSMRQLQDGGVEPHGWAVEPPKNSKAAAVLAAQAHVDDRTDTAVLFIVGNEPDPSRDRGAGHVANIAPYLDPLDPG